MTEKSGTFLVTEADEASAVLSAVDDGQVHALSTNPGVEAGDVIEGTVAADPPLEVTWSLVEVEERRRIEVERPSGPPSDEARAAAPDVPGELARDVVDGDELHVVAVEPGRAEDAAAEIVDDPAIRERAARLGATHVEVRVGGEFVSVRYV